jgi:hypothetical protein
MKDFAMELEDIRGANDNDEIATYKNEDGEYCIELYKPNKLIPYYKTVL